MRVLTFTSLFPNASQPLLGIFVAKRMAAFARRPGNVVEVIAPVPYFPRWAVWSRRRVFARIPQEEIIGDLTVGHPRYWLLPKVSMALHGWIMYRGSLALARRLHAHAPFDCIDAHYAYPDGFAAMLIGRALDVPVVVSARGTDINLFPSFPSILPLIRRTLERAAGIIAVSEALKEAIVDLGTPAAKIRVIPNGIDPGQFRHIDQKEARRVLGLPETGTMLLSVGGLSQHKGFHLLISALADLSPRYPDLRLYIVGEGTYRGEIEALIRRCALQAHIVLTGSRLNEQLLYWYNAADLTCLASLREGMPNVVLESLACGTPVLATRVGGMPEVVRPGENGVLVEPHSQAIAEGLEYALKMDWDHSTLSREAVKRTWDVVAAEVEAYLKSFLPRADHRTAKTAR